MNHLGTQKIQTERLILRKFQLQDAKYVFENWAGDSDVTEYLSWLPHADIKVSEDYIKTLIKNYEKNDTYDWAIVLKEINQPIGSITAIEVNEKAEKVHIGYCIGKKYWHLGITSEALKALINFFLLEVGVNKVESMHNPINLNSGKVMQKCGMKYEGTLRSFYKDNTGIVDAAFYGILKEDLEK